MLTTIGTANPFLGVYNGGISSTNALSWNAGFGGGNYQYIAQSPVAQLVYSPNSLGGLLQIRMAPTGTAGTTVAWGNVGGITINDVGKVGVGIDNAALLNGAVADFMVGTSTSPRTAASNGWGTYSDERLKRNLSRIPAAIDKLKDLNGYYYYLKNAADPRRQVGVMAQEVERVLPEVVTTAKDEIGTKAVDYSRLTALLIEAIKEQQREIEELKAAVCGTKPELSACRKDEGTAPKPPPE
jgi:hypothetical protein